MNKPRVFLRKKEKTLMLRTSKIFYQNRKQMPLQQEVYDIKGVNIVFKKGLSASKSKYSTNKSPRKHGPCHQDLMEGAGITTQLLYDNAKVGSAQGSQRLLKEMWRARQEREKMRMRRCPYLGRVLRKHGGLSWRKNSICKPGSGCTRL